MSYELKIKSKSLAAEARIIKALEERTKRLIKKRAAKQKPTGRLTAMRESLYHHRIDTVRTEARATFLARAYLKGMPRSAVEANQSPDYITSRSFKIAKKYASTPLDMDTYTAWMEA